MTSLGFSSEAVVRASLSLASSLNRIDGDANVAFANPDIVALNDGSAAVLYTVLGAAVDGEDTLVQMVDETGAVSGDPFALSGFGYEVDWSESIAERQAVALNNGGFSVVYHTDSSVVIDGERNHVFLAIFDEDGTRVVDDIFVNQNDIDDIHENVDIAVLEDGNIVVGYSDQFNSNSEPSAVFAIYSEEGAEIVAPTAAFDVGQFLPQDGISGRELDVKLAALDDGGFVVLVGDPAVNGGGFTRVFGADGTPTSEAVESSLVAEGVNSNNLWDRPQLDVVATGTGGFALQVKTTGISNEDDFAYEYYDADGNAVIGSIVVDDDVSQGSENNLTKDPVIFDIPGEGFGQIWLQNAGFGNTQVRLNTFGETGEARASDLAIITTRLTDGGGFTIEDRISDAKAVGLPNGNIVVVYLASNSVGLQEFDADGVAVSETAWVYDQRGEDLSADLRSGSTSFELEVLANGDVMVTFEGFAPGIGSSNIDVLTAVVTTSASGDIDDGDGSTANADFLRAGAGSDTITGGDGDDQIFAGPDDDDGDRFLGENGNDVVGGGAGNDTLFGGDGGDTLFGGIGNDTLDGDDDLAGTDFLWAGPGDDLVDGDDGDDNLGGGAGDDTLNGGAGNDIIYGGRGDQNDTGVNDVINGGAGADEVYAGVGNDSVTGGNGTELLFSGAGEDTVSGGGGADTIWGGGGDDSFTGDGGNDTFGFAAGNGNDTITDFTLSDDILLFSGVAANFAIRQDVIAAATVQNGGVLIDTGAGTSVFLEGLSLADLNTIILSFDS